MKSGLHSGLVVLLALIAVAVLGACVTDIEEGAGAEEVAAVESDGVGGQADAAEPSTPDLDADAVVAAQEEVINGVYEAVLPSVVHIRVVRRVDAGGLIPEPDIPPNFEFDLPDIPQPFFSLGEGSGFVWSEDGYIITNHHVVSGADRVEVTFSNGFEADAEVIGTDPDSDLAVVKVDVVPGELTAIVLGESSEIKVGQMAIAIGNPFGQSFTVTTGIVSALGRTIPSANARFSIPSVIQTDTAINPGNSGGPLLDRHGEVIGITTQIISQGGGTNVGVAFAVPVDIAKRVVPALISEGRYDYAFLGIMGVTLRPDLAELNNLPRDTRGALVIDTTTGGPARSAGVRASTRTGTLDGADIPVGGDVIVAIDGSPIQTMGDLIGFLVGTTRPGDVVTLDLLRDEGETVQVQVTLDSRPRA